MFTSFFYDMFKDEKGEVTTTKYVDFVYSSYHGKLTRSTCL